MAVELPPRTIVDALSRLPVEVLQAMRSRNLRQLERLRAEITLMEYQEEQFSEADALRGLEGASDAAVFEP